MSILKLKKQETREIEILGESFTFKSISAKRHFELMEVIETEDGKLIGKMMADILAESIVGEELTPDQILETFSMEEITEIGIAIINGFSGVEDAGKPS